MKKNKKILIIIISILCLVIIGLLLYFFVFKSDKNYLYEKELRYYNYEESRYKEYKYTCVKDTCASRALSDNNYLLTDDNKYIYNPIDNKKTKVDVDVEKVYTTLKDKDDKVMALILSDNGKYDGVKTLYLISDNKTYFQNDNYQDISLLGYEYFDEKADEYKQAVVNYDYVVVQNEHSNVIKVIDYKKNEVVFDSKKLDFKTKEDLSISFETIKVKDDLFFYKIECASGVSYLLNDKFKTISSYSSKGQMGQFGEGDQFLIHKNKVYIVNPDDKTFSIYDLEGKLLKKSATYKKVYCLAYGYILVAMEIDGENYEVAVDENGNELFRVESGDDMALLMYYNEKNNVLVIEHITGLDSGVSYSYSFKTKQVTKESYDYMGE